MADGARLILLVLVMGRADGKAGREVRRRRVALQAKRVHIGRVQHAGIGCPMWRVAAGAALGLHHRVLVDVWSGRLRVALGAYRILLRR